MATPKNDSDNPVSNAGDSDKKNSNLETENKKFSQEEKIQDNINDNKSFPDSNDEKSATSYQSIQRELAKNQPVQKKPKPTEDLYNKNTELLEKDLNNYQKNRETENNKFKTNIKIIADNDEKIKPYNEKITEFSRVKKEAESAKIDIKKSDKELSKLDKIDKNYKKESEEWNKILTKHKETLNSKLSEKEKNVKARETSGENLSMDKVSNEKSEKDRVDIAFLENKIKEIDKKLSILLTKESNNETKIGKERSKNKGLKETLKRNNKKIQEMENDLKENKIFQDGYKIDNEKKKKENEFIQTTIQALTQNMLSLEKDIQERKSPTQQPSSQSVIIDNNQMPQDSSATPASPTLNNKQPSDSDVVKNRKDAQSDFNFDSDVNFIQEPATHPIVKRVKPNISIENHAPILAEANKYIKNDSLLPKFQYNNEKAPIAMIFERIVSNKPESFIFNVSKNSFSTNTESVDTMVATLASAKFAFKNYQGKVRINTTPEKVNQWTEAAKINGYSDAEIKNMIHIKEPAAKITPSQKEPPQPESTPPTFRAR